MNECSSFAKMIEVFVQKQNRRQKVFTRGFAFLRGALGLCGWAWYSKNWQNLIWFIVFHVSIWGGWSVFWGAKPPKASPWRRDLSEV